MSRPAQQFSYVERATLHGQASLAPMLPLMLTGRHAFSTMGLLDSGAAVNVLPFQMGVQLGFDWDQQSQSVELSGNLASVEARVVVLTATVENCAPVRQAFAWCRSDAVPVILGQVNFFLEFDVCFFRSRALFEVSPKRSR